MIRYKELVSGQPLTATSAAYYAAPTGTSTAIHAVSVTNTTGAAVVVNLYRVPSGGAASNSNILASRTIAPNATVSMPDATNHKLAAGSSLFADGLGCALNVSGVEYIPGT